MRPPKRFKINGKQWKIRHGDPGRNNNGVTCYDDREMLIRNGLPKDEETGTSVHECVHAAAPYLTEDAVEAIELSVMNGLRWLGLLTEDD